MSTSIGNTLSVLAEPRRMRIAELLAENGQMNATQIANCFEVSSAAVSQHLKCLREAEVVTVSKRAQQRLYQLNPLVFNELEQWSRQIKETWSARFDQLDVLLQGPH